MSLHGSITGPLRGGGGDPGLVGQTFSGCTVERPLARGGMGSLYLARRQADGRAVVIKFLAPELAQDPGCRARFQREGEALLRIQPHPHVVRVFEVGEGDRPHIVMEYVEGNSLQEVLERRGRLSPQGAARVARDVALGLAVVHRAGLIHRDVKPANVVMTQFGDAKLVDFGVVKDVFSTGLTRPDELVGSAQYMAPEQWGDFEEDARCDVFALGATTYHALAGRPPFDGANWVEISTRIKAGEYTPLKKLLPTIPPELELVVAQMLVPDLRFRYANMEELAEDLGRVLRGEQAHVPCLMPDEGRARERFPLLPGRRFTIGRESGCDIVLRHPTISRHHADLRRESDAYVLTDAHSTYGTWVGEERLEGERALQDGDKLKLGDVVLRFVDPRGRAAPAPFLLDVARMERPAPLVEALVEMGDPRAVVHLLEQLAPDPAAEAAAEAGLRGLLEPTTLEAVRRRRHELQEARRALLRGRLEQITGQSLGDDPGAWLAWWDQARTEYPVQIGVEGPRPGLRLRVVEGEPTPTDLELREHGLLLLGRDPKCHLRLSNRTVSRLHARLLRLHRRLVAVDGGSRFGSKLEGVPLRVAFFDPGMRLELGDVRVLLEAEEPAGPTRAGLGHYAIDADSFQALVELRHPSVTAALVALLHEQRRGSWVESGARLLYPEDEQAAGRCRAHLAAYYQQHAERARTLLPQILEPAEPNHEITGWSQQLARRRSELPAQVLPRGWLNLTRTTSRHPLREE